jgi:hypothetical protein
LKLLVRYSCKDGKAQASSQPIKTVLAETTIRSGNLKTVEGSLKIPNDISPSNSSFCNVLQIEYVLGVKIWKKKVHLPITIGLVPLSQTSE